MKRHKRKPSIGWWVHCIHRHIMMLFDRELAPFGLTAGTFRFALHLLRQDGVTQEELTNEMRIDKGTTARALQKLESLGLVRREQDPADARAHRVYVTDKCRALESDFEEVFRREREALTRGLTADERRQALDLLSRIGVNIMEEVGAHQCVADRERKDTCRK